MDRWVSPSGLFRVRRESPPGEPLATAHSPLDHADRPEPGDLLGDPGLVDDVDDLVDVLVGGRLLLGEALVRRGPGR